MLKIVIWGATGQAIVLAELLSNTSVVIEAFFDNDSAIASPMKGVPIYHGESGLNQWKSIIEDKASYHYLIAIGGNNGVIRSEIGNMLKNTGLKPYTAIHHTAFVAANAVIGEGVQILANSNVCAKATIGNYCIINTAASVDHECIIGNNVHVGPGAKLAGCITIEDNVFIGTNATILPRIKVGKNAVIGAGAVVIRDVKPNSMVVGNPAKQI